MLFNKLQTSKNDHKIKQEKQRMLEALESSIRFAMVPEEMLLFRNEQAY